MARTISMVVIIGLALPAAWLVYATGGIRYSWSHPIYVPVVLGPFAFGIQGGILSGIVGGLALGVWYCRACLFRWSKKPC